jgi:hypothetical protein
VTTSVARSANNGSKSAAGSARRARGTTTAVVGRAAVTVVGAVVVAGAVSGCVTTQHTAKMVRLNNDRGVVSQADTRVVHVNSNVKPVKIGLVRSAHATALIVTIHNAGKRTQSDLPISVGYTRAGRTDYLNLSKSLKYFDTHLPGIRAHRNLTWVYTTPHQVPNGAHLFARIGQRPDPAAPAGTSPISLTLQTQSVSNDHLSLVVTNNSELPQYQLQIYSYARHDGRYVAAANVTLNGVNAGATEHVQLALVGKLAGAHPITTVVPTILQ